MVESIFGSCSTRPWDPRRVNRIIVRSKQAFPVLNKQEQEEHETDLQHKHVDACTCGRDNDRRDSSKFAEKSASDRSLSCVWACG